MGAGREARAVVVGAGAVVVRVGPTVATGAVVVAAGLEAGALVVGAAAAAVTV
jgi:hypothetical protein